MLKYDNLLTRWMNSNISELKTVAKHVKVVLVNLMQLKNVFIWKHREVKPRDIDIILISVIWKREKNCILVL